MMKNIVIVKLLLKANHFTQISAYYIYLLGFKQSYSRSRLTVTISHCDIAFFTRCILTRPLFWSDDDTYEDSSCHCQQATISKVLSLCKCVFLLISIVCARVGCFTEIPSRSMNYTQLLSVVGELWQFGVVEMARRIFIMLSKSFSHTGGKEFVIMVTNTTEGQTREVGRGRFEKNTFCGG